MRRGPVMWSSLSGGVLAMTDMLAADQGVYPSSQSSQRREQDRITGQDGNGLLEKNGSWNGRQMRRGLAGRLAEC